MVRFRPWRSLVVAALGALGLGLAASMTAAQDSTVAGAGADPAVPGFRAIGKNAQGLPEYRHEKTGLVFVRIPGGKFEMGSPDDEVGRFKSEGPVHEVALQSFLLCKTEMTQGVWEKIIGTRPWWGTAYMVNGDDYPAVHVTWPDARAFCAKAGLRLPSEAEWEYACRGGTRTRYFFGDDEDRLGEFAWYDDNTWEIGRRYFARVARKKPNPYGLYDILGNVSEWCEDTWHPDYNGAPTDGSAWSTGDTPQRAYRGGSWLYEAWTLRSATRLRDPVTFCNGHVGFRPAASIPGTTAKTEKNGK